MSALDQSFTLSARCKVLTVLGGVLILGEIAIVARWEETNMNSPSFARGLYAKYYAPTFQGKITAMNLTDEEFMKNLTKEAEAKLINATDKKIILIWIPMFGVKDAKHIPRDTCGNCEVTYERQLINDERTGAVVFHFDALRQSNVPKERYINQLHIYWDLESTATLRVTRGVSLNFEESYGFNATMTYRRDSDFYMSYEYDGTLSQIIRNNELSLEELFQQKSKTAIAVVSNCGITVGSRTRISKLRELSKELQLDLYGGCFGRRLKNEEFPREVRKHKFYISFENSHHCKDYITEKFFSNALKNNAVPVVWGATREDYEAVAPPGSFIFADDFPSIKDLANYLKYLDENPTEYLKYLKWLTMAPEDMPQSGRGRGFCSICRALHGINIDDIYNPKFNASKPERPIFTEGIAQRMVPSIKAWFYGEDNDECFKT